ncbi:MAG TPA: hypothetical protein VLZ81_02725 [Blastocatellia bacterium]|nr:hypothetical protein [Blastocatellia bacterium]
MNQLEPLARLIVIPLALMLLPFSPSRVQNEPGLKITTEEYQIYSSLIKQFYYKPEFHMIVIVDRTFTYDPRRGDDDEPWRDKPKKKRDVAIDPSTLADYGLKNTDHWVLDKDAFKLPVKCELVTSPDLYAIFHGREMGQVEWLEFFKRFQDAAGFLMISRIGFNTDHNQAMLYMGSRCGPLCWDLHFLLLEKVGAEWKIKKQLRNDGSG